MPKITAIREQKRKGRFNVYLDGKFAFGLPAEALAKAGLKIGQEISEKEIKKLRDKNIEGKLYNQALKFLSYRPRSEKEVGDYLRRKISVRQLAGQRQSALIESVASRLKSQDLINDSEFTKWWIEQRQSFKPKGIYALTQELGQKGISREIIDSLVTGHWSPVTERALALKAIHKKLKLLRSLTPKEFRLKLTAFLSRRGFSYETIKLVLDEILSRE